MLRVKNKVLQNNNRPLRHLTFLTYTKRNHGVNILIFNCHIQPINSNIFSLYNKIPKSIARLSFMRDSFLQQSAIFYALKLLGLRNHSRRELEQKLLKKGYDAGSIDETMEKLANRGVLDDRAFGMELIRSRSRRKPAGKLKIAAELRKKGVAEAIIDELLKEYDCAALCLRAAEKKIRSLHEATEAGRKRKLEVFLCNRGFAWPEIQGAIRQLFTTGSDFEEPC